MPSPLFEPRRARPTITGTLKLLGHCEFEWSQVEGQIERYVRVEAHHCSRCVEALREHVGDGFLIDRRRAF